MNILKRRGEKIWEEIIFNISQESPMSYESYQDTN